jgi:exopolysaccharide biosynthesis protein
MPAWLPFAAAANVLWQLVAPGVWRAEAPMASRGALASVRATMLRLDPSQVRFELHTATRDLGMRGAWTVDSLPAGALAAFNAGQFDSAEPWGWLVRQGREEQPPGVGPLSMAFVVDAEGHVALVERGALDGARARAWLAFQSYPALLVEDGRPPWQLQGRDRGVNVGHRDARLALGVRADGHVVVALTRFTGLGEAGEQLPWGPTVGEMSAWMKSLGCRRAMLLDGGLSSQMAVRDRGAVTRWPNLRPVPMGLVVIPRGEEVAAATPRAAAK